MTFHYDTLRDKREIGAISRNITSTDVFVVNFIVEKLCSCEIGTPNRCNWM